MGGNQARVALLRSAGSSRNSGAEGRKLAALMRISQALAHETDLDKLITQVAREVCGLVQADQVFLLLRDSEDELHIRSEFGRINAPNQQYVSQSVCHDVLQGDSVLIPEALSHPSYQTQESVVALNLRSVMAAPLTGVGDKTDVIGVLYVCSYSTGELFGDADIGLLKAFAAQVSIHISWAKLMTQQEKLLRDTQTLVDRQARILDVAMHELKTPMQSIWLAVSILKTAIEAQPNPSEELLDLVHTATRGLQRMKDSFVDPLWESRQLDVLLSRLNLSPVDQEAIITMISRWRRQFTRHTLQTFDRLPISVDVDIELFDRALSHLVENAVNYSPEGSTIEIKAVKNKGELVITVEDNGIGIPPEDLPYVTTWLYRGANVANNAAYPPGLGIGLDEVLRIVEAHGGRLNIESVLGQGTRAVMIFPV